MNPSISPSRWTWHDYSEAYDETRADHAPEPTCNCGHAYTEHTFSKEAPQGRCIFNSCECNGFDDVTRQMAFDD